VYAATWESVSSHPLPDWYDDAKIGVFLHWGPYSVPGWAPRVAPIHELLRDHGPRYVLANNPYAEWYANTLRIPNSPTQLHHFATYGRDYPYERFAEAFDERSQHADLEALAGLCSRSGARYVVLTTKHHDGFTLWPSAVDHPARGAYHSRRDLVGGLGEAVAARGMRIGLYYSGGYDWPFNDAVIAGVADAVLATPRGPQYLAYATAHLKELIDRYSPAVLWNDICWPSGGNLAEIFAHYYNRVEDGVVNDRWSETRLRGGRAAELALEIVGVLVESAWRLIPDKKKQLVMSSKGHFDFETREYERFATVRKRKWEATRGVGHSFGANRAEPVEDLITAAELVRLLVDVVSKNGNLLIGVGPDPEGRVPQEQAAPLLGLGEWLEVNGEAVYATRPWHRAEGRTLQGTPLRFTTRGETLYAVLLETPPSARLDFVDVDARAVEEVRLLGLDQPLSWSVEAGRLSVELPERLALSPAHTLRLSPVRAPVTDHR
jgi:alpha-L-fucosidase